MGKAPPPRLAAVITLLGGWIALVVGCSTDQVGPSGNQVRIIDPQGRLRGHAAVIDSMARATIVTVNTRLAIRNVTITIRPDPANAIVGWGVGGFTPDAGTVSIYIDPDVPDLGALLPERLPPMIAHELHHTVRHRRPGYGITLLEAMVSEGMADRFAMELLGTPIAPWSAALGAEDAARWLDLARPELDTRGYDHPKWFFGTTGVVPRWTGYTLGYKMVAAYQAAHPGSTAADLVATSAADFRP